MSKHAITSKTMWLNAVIIGVTATLGALGVPIPEPTIALVLVGVANAIMRLVTKDAVYLK